MDCTCRDLKLSSPLLAEVKMTKKVYAFTVTYIALILFFTSCHTSQKYVAHKNSREPKFMADVYIPPHAAPATAPKPLAKAPEIKTVIPTAEVTDNSAPEESEPVAAAPEQRVTIIHLPPKNKPTKDTEPIKPTGANDDTHNICSKYADLLGISPGDISNSCLYEFIEKWYGANYKLGGTDTDGIDCSAFAQRLYNDIYGIDLTRTAKEQFSSCKRLKHPTEAKEGDLVFFHVHSRRITHVGIYLANDYFVHASSSQGVVISNLKDQYWRKFFAGCGRVMHGQFARTETTAKTRKNTHKDHENI